VVAAAIGYLGYVLINLWGPLQIAHMLRGQHVELGRAPLVSLMLGLVCLQVSFALDGLPLYTQVGNGAGLTFSTVMLVIVSRKGRIQ
jgi:hypothetical protein